MGALKEIFQDMGDSDDVLFDCLIDDRKEPKNDNPDSQKPPGGTAERPDVEDR